MTDGVVTFNYPVWEAQYPEFANVAEPQAQGFFNRVTAMMIDNTACSPIQDLFRRTVILNAAVAHMASLFAPGTAGGKPRALVGRISSATEGTVTVQTEYKIPTSNLEAWWNQTPYGAEVWAALTMFRAPFYVPPPCPIGPVTGVGLALGRVGYFWRR